jgi:hypothetical protein
VGCERKSSHLRKTRATPALIVKICTLSTGIFFNCRFNAVHFTKRKSQFGDREFSSIQAYKTGAKNTR